MLGCLKGFTIMNFSIKNDCLTKQISLLSKTLLYLHIKDLTLDNKEPFLDFYSLLKFTDLTEFSFQDKCIKQHEDIDALLYLRDSKSKSSFHGRLYNSSFPNLCELCSLKFLDLTYCHLSLTMSDFQIWKLPPSLKVIQKKQKRSTEELFSYLLYSRNDGRL